MALSTRDVTAGQSPLIPWKEAKKDSEIVAKILAYREKLAESCRKWGQEQGISDLSLAMILTIPNPEKKVYHFWKADGGQNKAGDWIRVRDGDEYPSWIVKLGRNARDVMYDPTTGAYGQHVPQEARSKLTVRSGKKVTSMADLLK